MSIFGDIFKTLLPIGASFIPGIGPIAGPALAALMGQGGGGNAASMIAGQMTGQRMPGQTTAGEYTPQAGSMGTYNYIPTGATQIDPALIQMILGSAGQNTDTNNFMNPANTQLAQQGMNNPYLAAMMSGLSANAANASGMGNMLSASMPGIMQGAYNTTSQAGDLISQLQGLVPGLTQGAYNNTWQAGNILSQAQNNPYAQQMISGAQNIGQGMVGAGGQLQGGATDYLSSIGNTVGSLNNNPYTAMAQQGGNQAGGMLQQAGTGGFNQGQQLSGAASAGLPASQSVLNTAFDPQQQLYNRTLQQTQDQLGAFLARSGLTNSGAGAQIASDAFNNFNIDWQNNQLGRQLEGLQGYNSGISGAGSNMGAGNNMMTQGAGTYAQGAALPAQTYQNLGAMQLDNLGRVGSALGQAGGALGQAGNLQLGGNSAGYDASMGNLAQLGNFNTAYGNAVGQQGTMFNNVGNIMGNAISGYGNAVGNQSTVAGNMGNLGNTITNLGQYGATAPYQGYQTGYGDMNTALVNYLTNASSGSNLYNQNIGQFQNYLGGVMTGANNASSAASGAQNRTTDQNASAAAGISPLIQGGLNALGNLFRPQTGSASSYYPSWATGR